MNNVFCGLKLPLFTVLLVVVATSAGGEVPKISVEIDDQGATISIDGELFTRYLINSGTRPVLWPVIGPTGKRMTRAYPMTEQGPHENADHPHHRSIWFGYEGINGVNFWHEPRDLDKLGPHDGRQVHVEFVTAQSDGETATLVTRNEYQNATGEVVALDERTVKFGVDGDARWIDYQIKLWSPEGPLTIADTKEGAFAVRVAGTMKVDAKMGGKIVTSNGDEDVAAWGKPAEWVDYHGPVDGETLGIAILAHPTSHKAMPRWHVRTYGLFAVNPFSGPRAYDQGSERGGIQVAENEPVVLRHRVILHKGDHHDGGIAKAYEQYAESE